MIDSLLVGWREGYKRGGLFFGLYLVFHREGALADEVVVGELPSVTNSGHGEVTIVEEALSSGLDILFGDGHHTGNHLSGVDSAAVGQKVATNIFGNLLLTMWMNKKRTAKRKTRVALTEEELSRVLSKLETMLCLASNR